MRFIQGMDTKENLKYVEKTKLLTKNHIDIDRQLAILKDPLQSRFNGLTGEYQILCAVKHRNPEEEMLSAGLQAINQSIRTLWQ